MRLEIGIHARIETRTALRAAHGERERRGLVVRQMFEHADRDQARARQPALLILDTHLLSNMLWSQTLFGDCPAWIEQALLARDYHLHLLLDPRGVPWVDDGQRCQPELAQRVAFYEQCAGWLRQHQQPLQCIKGDWRERREQTLTAVAQWLGSPHQHAGPGQQ